MNSQTIPAEADKKCDCCKRLHRKLHLVDGFWMGETCAQSYKLWRDWPTARKNSFYGYEKQLARITNMTGATK